MITDRPELHVKRSFTTAKKFGIQATTPHTQSRVKTFCVFRHPKHPLSCKQTARTQQSLPFLVEIVVA